VVDKDSEEAGTALEQLQGQSRTRMVVVAAAPVEEAPVDPNLGRMSDAAAQVRMRSTLAHSAEAEEAASAAHEGVGSSDADAADDASEDQHAYRSDVHA